MREISFGATSDTVPPESLCKAGDTVPGSRSIACLARLMARFAATCAFVEVRPCRTDAVDGARHCIAIHTGSILTPIAILQLASDASAVDCFVTLRALCNTLFAE